jgi:hypothetical protein
MTHYEAVAISFGRVRNARRPGTRSWAEKRDTIEDPRIFGAEHDDVCACGKYEGILYHGMICDRCGVKVVASAREHRRKRFGHIELAEPIQHPLVSEPARLHAFPVLPAQVLDSEEGRRLAPHYDAIIVAANAGPGDEVARCVEGLAEVLVPIIETALRWGLPDASLLAHGLALEERTEDPFSEPDNRKSI